MKSPMNQGGKQAQGATECKNRTATCTPTNAKSVQSGSPDVPSTMTRFWEMTALLAIAMLVSAMLVCLPMVQF